MFIPDTDYIQRSFMTFVDELKVKFGFNTDFFVQLFQNEAVVEDIYTDISIPNVGTFKLKLLDTKYLVDGVTYFRPFIRGFLAILIILYNIRQLIGFFGYDAGVVAGRNEEIKASKERQKE